MLSKEIKIEKLVNYKGHICDAIIGSNKYGDAVVHIRSHNSHAARLPGESTFKRYSVDEMYKIRDYILLIKLGEITNAQEFQDDSHKTVGNPRKYVREKYVVAD